MSMFVREIRRDIETAKLTLDGARQLAESRPSAENKDFVKRCEALLDDLLDHYPH
jgi:hypothetical protein